MSQTALASGICSASAVSRWEDGQSVPSDEVVVQLAQRLGIHPDILLHRDFDSRLLSSHADFGELVYIVFGPTGTEVDGGNPSSVIGTWIARARYVLACADPWTGGEPRPVVDELAVDSLTSSNPVALETVELLDAFVRVGEDPSAESVDALVETLTWTVDAPERIRRSAMETVVAVLVFAEMPVAARGAVARVGPTHISETTCVLLESGGQVPPVYGERSARDVAVSLLARLASESDLGFTATVDAVLSACPGDSMVKEYARRITAGAVKNRPY